MEDLGDRLIAEINDGTKRPNPKPFFSRGGRTDIQNSGDTPQMKKNVNNLMLWIRAGAITAKATSRRRFSLMRTPAG
jgi:hypothetical protein